MSEQPAPSAAELSEQAEEALDTWRATRPNCVAFDTETTGVTFFDEAFGFTCAWDRDEGDYVGFYLELSEEVPRAVAQEILDDTPTWVFHNPKFDLQKLILGGVIGRDWLNTVDLHDTEAIAHLLDENSGKKLKELAVAHLDWDDTIEVPLKSDPSRSRLVSREKWELDQERKRVGKLLGKNMSEVGFHEIDRAVLIPYAIQDACMTIMLFDKLWPILEGKDEELLELYRREMELALVLLDVESAGMALDLEYLEEARRTTATNLFKQELTIRKITGREEFVDHHEWIRTAFAEQGISLPNTQKATLKEVKHPLAQALLEFRRLKKLHSTYFTAMLNEQRDGILHPGFRQHGTRTGRMSSGGVIE